MMTMKMKMMMMMMVVVMMMSEEFCLSKRCFVFLAIFSPKLINLNGTEISDSVVILLNKCASRDRLLAFIILKGLANEFKL